MTSVGVEEFTVHSPYFRVFPHNAPHTLPQLITKWHYEIRARTIISSSSLFLSPLPAVLEYSGIVNPPARVTAESLVSAGKSVEFVTRLPYSPVVGGSINKLVPLRFYGLFIDGGADVQIKQSSPDADSSKILIALPQFAARSCVLPWLNTVATDAGLARCQMQVNAAGDLCAICQEKMHAPILLRCKHIFCEGCATEWLEVGERERERGLVPCVGLWSDGDFA
ncbi:hypothetical protein MLD38_002718 [Melastoma candidum]|uniref:Uncharacterized protein n=1 Tax=Melastoma candidum TaxID=119954 RepID=A0ACB9S418_9MYRT|nr:hypothetical protein MLD38_002718 [Melastoma candidum]